MPRKARTGGLARGCALVFFVALSALAGCSHPPPEQALRDTIAKMHAAGESHDIDGLFDPIAEDFAGEGGMDRKSFHAYVALMSMRNRNIGATLGPIDVKMFGDRATATFTVAIRGGEGLLPDQAQVYAVETGWRMEGNDWKLISASWKPQL